VFDVVVVVVVVVVVANVVDFVDAVVVGKAVAVGIMAPATTASTDSSRSQ